MALNEDGFVSDDRNSYEFDVVCHTRGCENYLIPIHVASSEPTLIVSCGPCGKKIRDVTDITSV